MRAAWVQLLGLCLYSAGAFGAEEAATPAAGAPVRIVAIVPFGEVPRAHLQVVARAIEARSAVVVRIQPARPLPREAFYEPRKRWRAEKLLETLDAEAPADAWKVVGVTAAELSTTKDEIFDWGIAGLGNIGGKSCVVTTYLYTKHHKVKGDVERRLEDLSVHEFGHTLGLPHCRTDRCVMADAKGKALKSADRSTGQFCQLCRSGLTGNVLKPKP